MLKKSLCSVCLPTWWEKIEDIINYRSHHSNLYEIPEKLEENSKDGESSLNSRLLNHSKNFPLVSYAKLKFENDWMKNFYSYFFKSRRRYSSIVTKNSTNPMSKFIQWWSITCRNKNKFIRWNWKLNSARDGMEALKAHFKMETNLNLISFSIFSHNKHKLPGRNIFRS